MKEGEHPIETGSARPPKENQVEQPRLRVLYGTQTGTCRKFAQQLAAMAGDGLHVDVQNIKVHRGMTLTVYRGVAVVVVYSSSSTQQPQQ